MQPTATARLWINVSLAKLPELAQLYALGSWLRLLMRATVHVCAPCPFDRPNVLLTVAACFGLVLANAARECHQNLPICHQRVRHVPAFSRSS